MPRKDPERQRAEPHAENHGRNRQGRKSLVGREHRADDAGGGNDHRIVTTGKRLRDREHDRVAARERIIGLMCWNDSAVADIERAPGGRPL